METNFKSLPLDSKHEPLIGDPDYVNEIKMSISIADAMSQSGSWTVTTEKLISSANLIREKTERYKAEYEKLYTEVQNLKSSQWQGIASDAFNTKLENFRANFEQLEKLLSSYCESLTAKAQRYDKAEESIGDEIERL